MPKVQLKLLIRQAGLQFELFISNIVQFKEDLDPNMTKGTYHSRPSSIARPVTQRNMSPSV